MRGLPVWMFAGFSPRRAVARVGLRRACTVLGALLGILVPAAAVAAAPGAPPEVRGRSAAVLDVRDGAVLWSENGRLRLPMASTTKMMTALVACRLLNDNANAPMVVPPDVQQAYGELLYLRPGDRYTFLQLLEGMLLPSANDAAIAIAVNAAGSQQRFVEAMNSEAQALGLTDTHFANPDGLEDPDHYSSAIDLARLGQAALRDPMIENVVRLPSATIPWPDHGGTRVVGNINALLAYFPGATGIKTGYTSQAQNVVVGSATRDGQSVIAVVMGEPAGSLWRDDEDVLRYGLTLAAARAPTANVDAAGPKPAPVAPVRVVPATAAPDLHQDIGSGSSLVGASHGGGPSIGGASGGIAAVVLPAVPVVGADSRPGAPGAALPRDPASATGPGGSDALPPHPRDVALGGVLALIALAGGLVWRRGAAVPRSSWRGRRQPETWMAP